MSRLLVFLFRLAADVIFWWAAAVAGLGIEALMLRETAVSASEIGLWALGLAIPLALLSRTGDLRQ